MPDSRPIDFLTHVRSESARFAEAVAAADPAARVPSCPDWDADDLLWHLAEVQDFWATIVRERFQTEEEAEGVERTRPGSHDELTDYFAGASAALIEALAATSDDVNVWTWAPEQSVGFIRRRQAHEALIHRIDAELVSDSRTPLDPALALDGVDEVLRVMYGGVPTWGTFTADPAATVRVTATDSGATWFLTCGTFVGTAPTGEEVDAADLRVADTDLGASAAAQIRGTAADLDCWLWHRPPFGEVEQTGDAGVLATFNSTIAPGID